MSLTRKLKNAGFWQLFQVVSQILIQFGYMAIMARLLSKDDFGLMAMATAFIGLGMIFSTGGMGGALIQRKNVTQKHINAAFQGSFLLGLVVSCVLVSTSGAISTFYGEPNLKPIINIIGLGVIFNSISSVSRSLLQKSFNFKATANITIFITIISYSLGICLAFLDYGVWSLVITSLCSSILTAVMMFYFSPIKLISRFHYVEFKQLFSYGFGLTLLSLNNYLANGGLNLVLGKIFTPAVLGVFERTYIIKGLPSQYLGNIIDTIMFPAMSQIQDEQAKLFRVYQSSLGIVNTILIPVAVFLIFFSKEVVLILLGNKWLDAVIPLQIMFSILPFNASGRMTDSLLRAKGYIYRNVVRKFIYAIVLIGSAAFGANYYGIMGAAIAVTFSYLFNYFMMLSLVKGIFDKNLKEIFLVPILSGVKISIIVLFFAIVATYLLDNSTHDSIISFFISTFLIVLSFLVMVWIRPKILGIYLYEVLSKFSIIKK